MKSQKSIYIAILIGAAVITSCKKNKNVYTDDLTVSIDENPQDSALVGQVTATTEKSYITYEFLSQSPEGAMYLDESTGELFVQDKSKFNFEANAVITAVVEASNGKNSAKSNVTVNLNDVLEIPANVGDYRDGGIVFWIDPTDNTKGLVCAITDQSTGAEWGCYDLFNPQAITGADGTGIGTGNQNTLDIEAGCTTTGTGADVCANLVLNGYSDWFLPSRDELISMYTHKSVINATALSNGGTALDESVYYWSSSEFSADKAYDFYFASGVSDTSLKLNSFTVRAVRAF